MTTIDPLHDYEHESAAKARLRGKLQEDCECPACQFAGVGKGRDGKILMRSSRVVNRQTEFIGRWYHGLELKAELAQRRRDFDAMKQAILGHATVER